MPIINAYALVTHGKKPKPGETDHPSIRKQIANIRQALSQHEVERVQVASDYARQIRSMDDLPTLKQILSAMKANNAGKLVVDDLSRLFRICPIDARFALLNSLEPFGKHLFDLRLLGLLARVPAEKKAVFLKHADMMSGWEMSGARKNLGTASKRAESTRTAREASVAARSIARDHRDAELLRLHDEVAAESVTFTMKDLAARANASGMRTGHGRPWNARSVGDVLRRQRGQAK